MVQCLRIHAVKAGGLGLIPGQGTRFHMLKLKIPCATNGKKKKGSHMLQQRSRIPQAATKIQYNK